MIVIICAKYKKNPSRTVDATERTRFSKSRPNDLEDIKSRSKVIVRDTPSHGSDHLWLIWKESIQNCRCYRADTAGGTDGQTDGVKPIYPPTTSLVGGYKKTSKLLALYEGNSPVFSSFPSLRPITPKMYMYTSIMSWRHNASTGMLQDP